MVDSFDSPFGSDATHLAASDSLTGKDLTIPSSSLVEEKVTWRGRVWKIISYIPNPLKVVEYFVGGTLIVIMAVEMVVRRMFCCNGPHEEQIYNEVGRTFLGFTPKFD